MDDAKARAAQANPAAASEWQQQWEAQARAASEAQAALRSQGPGLHTADKLGAAEQAAQQLEAKLGELKGSSGAGGGYDPVLGEDVRIVGKLVQRRRSTAYAGRPADAVHCLAPASLGEMQERRRVQERRPPSQEQDPLQRHRVVLARSIKSLRDEAAALSEQIFSVMRRKRRTELYGQLQQLSCALDDVVERLDRLPLGREYPGTESLRKSRRQVIATIQEELADLDAFLRDVRGVRGAVGRLNQLLDALREAHEEFRCPVLLDVMRRPVRVASGKVYDAEALRGERERSARTGLPSLCPLTRRPIPPEQDRLDTALQGAIRRAVEGAIAEQAASEAEREAMLRAWRRQVDWYPWGEEAFEKARREDKPIFLSIGYSTCHWCHVMERESFESEVVAKLLSASFVSIKASQDPVDREERPDVDKVYMSYVQVWDTKRDEIKASSAASMRQLADLMRPELTQRFDAQRGGFGGAPKFPRPAELNALLAQHERLAAAGDKQSADRALHMVALTLRKMAAGGMWDHVGGGFHRYSVDEHFHVPHFEKMLYDNPQLASTYLAAFQLTGDAEFAGVARGVLDYLMRDMTHPEGGIYAAEDADSLDPGSGQKKEGWFYVWSKLDVEELLGPDAAAVFCSHYYVKPEGNCDLSPRSDPHGEFAGLNCLIARQTLPETAAAAGKSEAEAEALLAACREKLFAAREKRPRPHRDDKIVAAWNGMSIAAFAQAARVLAGQEDPAGRCFPVEGRPPGEYLAAAEQVAAFVGTHLYDAPSGTLRRAYTNGPSEVAAFADDYAYMVSGLLELYFATGDAAHLHWASELQAKMDELFWDEVGGAYFNNTADDPSIKMRLKEDYDGAEPAASSIAAANLWYLAGLSGTEESARLRERCAQCVAAFSERLSEAPVALPQMAASVHLLTLGYPRQVIVAGKRGAPDTEAMVAAVYRPFTPDKVVIHLDPSDSELTEFWRRRNPEALAVAEHTGFEAGEPATAFVCQNFTCRRPSTDAAQVEALLREPRSSAVAPPKPVQLSSLLRGGGGGGAPSAASGGLLGKLKGLAGLPAVKAHQEPGLQRQDSFPEICSTPSEIGIFEVAHTKCRGADGKFSWRKFFFEAPSHPDTPRGGATNGAAPPQMGTSAAAAAAAASGSNSASQ
ncbi:spermatogenesis-associated 20 isoform B [Micractinium conductrix]|uniref:Spermatogenesis-associated 20 isoform B n=1 Tax=Micractinium conductrix TaxID=554055 RepID=A0A2P6V8L0_9CHLO|nr:spermatogenesis-associated 20 isoform B [Micractinium conductrix]|eukprot:PSC70426.1 spermatogenesis-associated 20 isoform B [Micractinium conductrix]